MNADYSSVESTARDYYNSEDADNFYYHVWGGEDIHIGIYDNPSITIANASQLTVQMMAGYLNNINNESFVVDVGSGYGGAARYLSGRFGCKVACVNISEVENERNREYNSRHGLGDRIEVQDASFESIPYPDNTFDFAWSQDAILHSGNREKVMQEVHRVLKPGGEFIFTDPMQADDANHDSLKPVLERIHLDTMGSFSFYKSTAQNLGMEILQTKDMTENLIKHYSRVHDDLIARREEIENYVSKEYIDRMIIGLNNWVKAGKEGQLSWGIIHLKKR